MDKNKSAISFSIPDEDNGAGSEFAPQKLADGISRINNTINMLEVLFSKDYSGIVRAISTFAKALYSIDYQQIFNNISNALNNLSEIILNIASPLPEEKRKALIESYKQWGKLGWTVPVTASIDFLDTPPNEDIWQAHNYIMSLFRKKSETTRLFNEIREFIPKNNNFESAVFCFENRQYTACALLLFSMIDSKLIRIQHKSQDLKTGMSAVIKLRNQYKNHGDLEILFHMLQYVNLFSCLIEMFQDTENFSKKLPVINRNYVAHGMNKRPVRKRDCIQLFLVLANIDFFLADKE